MVGCVLSQLKPSEFYILSFEKVKNVEFLGLYPIRKMIIGCSSLSRVVHSEAVD